MGEIVYVAKRRVVLTFSEDEVANEFSRITEGILMYVRKPNTKNKGKWFRKHAHSWVADNVAYVEHRIRQHCAEIAKCTNNQVTQRELCSARFIKAVIFLVAMDERHAPKIKVKYTDNEIQCVD